MSKFNYKIPFRGILLILFELGFGLNIELVGSISVSEIFVFCYTLYFLFRDPMINEHSFRRLIYIYGGLLSFQILSETIVSTSLSNSLKGISITAISFCHLYFLIRMFKKSTYYVIWAYAGMLIKPFIIESGFQGDTMLALTGMDNVYLKFVIAPLLLNVTLLYSYFNDNRKTCLILMFLGTMFIFLGARSWGALSFAAGVITYFIITSKSINYKRLLSYSAVALAVIYGAYILYVDNVLSGKIVTGNSGQIYRTENPYNPVNLLKVGRTETFVGTVAFLDKPLWGHGAWKKDSDYGYHYTMMKSQYQHLDTYVYKDDADLVPCHSVLVGFGCYNGIFAFIFGLILLSWFVKMGLYNIFESKRYVIMLTYFLIIFSWHALFSPQSHFRLTLPLYMAFIYVIYHSHKRQMEYLQILRAAEIEAAEKYTDETEEIEKKQDEEKQKEIMRLKDARIRNFQKRHRQQMQ